MYFSEIVYTFSVSGMCKDRSFLHFQSDVFTKGDLVQVNRSLKTIEDWLILKHVYIELEDDFVERLVVK